MVQNGIFKIIVGNQAVGMITEAILKVETNLTLYSTFWVNVPQVIKSLKENPTISMANKDVLRITVDTEQYSLLYLLAPNTLLERDFGFNEKFGEIDGQKGGRILDYYYQNRLREEEEKNKITDNNLPPSTDEKKSKIREGKQYYFS